MPVGKSVGDTVIGGTMNQSGAFVMRADKTAAIRCWRRSCGCWRKRSVAARRSSASRTKFPAGCAAGHRGRRARFRRLGDLGTGAAAGLWPCSRRSRCLIIACPCALGLATPMSIMVGVGRGAHAGDPDQNAEALERLEKVDTLVVDKTGTLTVGKPTVVALKPAPGISEETLLQFAAQPRARQRASPCGGDHARCGRSRVSTG